MRKIVSRTSKKEIPYYQKKYLIQAYQNAILTKDFKGFCSFVDIKTKKEEKGKSNKMKFNYSEWFEPQKLFEETRCKRDIVLKPRRIGFSTMELVRDLFFAITNSDVSVCIVAQSDDVAEGLLVSIQTMFEDLEELQESLEMDGVKAVLLPERKIWTRKHISFSNGSNIFYITAKHHESLARNSGRGLTIDRLHATEVAFWQHDELTMTVLLSATDSAQEIVIESTPNGAKGFFYEFFWRVEGGALSDWKCHFYPWHCLSSYKKELIEGEVIDMKPRDTAEVSLIERYQITPEQMKWWRDQVGKFGLKATIQEYAIDVDTCFAAVSGTFLQQEDFMFMNSCICEPQKELAFDNCFGTPVKCWIEPQPKVQYLIGADSAYGIGQDSSTFCVIEKATGEIAATYCSNDIKPNQFAELLYEVGKHYNTALIGVELQATGRTIIEKLEEKHYRNLYKHNQAKQNGWQTTGTSRVKLFNLYQELINTKDVKIVDARLMQEARTLTIIDNRIDHMVGASSDMTFAFMIAQMMRREYASTGGLSLTPFISRNATHDRPMSFGRPRFR